MLGTIRAFSERKWQQPLPGGPHILVGKMELDNHAREASSKVRKDWEERKMVWAEEGHCRSRKASEYAVLIWDLRGKKGLAGKWERRSIQNKGWSPQYNNQGLCNLASIHFLPLLLHLLMLNSSPGCHLFACCIDPIPIRSYSVCFLCLGIPFIFLPIKWFPILNCSLI